MENSFKGLPYTEVIMKEMCKRVKAPYNKINFKKKEWFTKYQWTEPQREGFKKWLVDYLKKNSGARQEMLDRTSANPKILEKVADWVILNFGWKLKQNGI